MQISFRNMDETSLAAFQQVQVGNSCAISAACAALNLLSGKEIQAEVWRNRVDSIPFPDVLRYRSLRGGPTMPAQQINLVEWMAFVHQIRIRRVHRVSLRIPDLLHELSSGTSTVMLTIGWWMGRAPEIINGKSCKDLNKNATWIGYHTMLLAAYDEGHICDDGIIRPWGLINSWQTGGPYLYWMQDQELMRSWGVYTPGGGVRASVLIKLL
jgi:hypothetical protein